MQIQFPEWRDENETTRYPFTSRATLTNGAGRVIIEGALLDAALYPVGATGSLYLSRVLVTHQEMTFTVGDAVDKARASGSVSLVDPPDSVALFDPQGRPAGVLVSESTRLLTFQAMGVGTHDFSVTQTEFCPTVCFPTSEPGLRGIMLESGEIFTGDVWLVGSDGVVLSSETITLPPEAGLPERPGTAIRIDVVGDPLFRRRLCQNVDLFETPRFIKTVRFIGPNLTFECEPNELGDITIVASDDLAADSALRIVPQADGFRIHVAGQEVGI